MLYVIACVVMAMLLLADVVLGIYAYRHDNADASSFRRRFIDPRKRIDRAFAVVAVVALVGGYLWGWELGVLVTAHVAALFIGGWYFTGERYECHRRMMALKAWQPGGLR